jgi:hypothetical protein
LQSAVVYAYQWQELNGEHFFVYFVDDENFAKDVLNKAEEHYRRIAIELGYPRYSQFWLWNNRVKIYIYPDHKSFIKATHQPQWSHGMADYTNRRIISYIWSEDFTESLLPHEMAHLIFRDFVGFEGEIPLWLDEGVAQWSEIAKRDIRKNAILELFSEDKVLKIEDLMRLDVRNIKNKDKITIRIIRTRDNKDGVLFVDKGNLVKIFYLEAVSIVDFLVDRYGSDRFAHFCRQLRDGKSMEEALAFAYPTYIRNLQDLEDNWRKYMEDELKRRGNE